jgi:hypothetical protein
MAQRRGKSFDFELLALCSTTFGHGFLPALFFLRSSFPRCSIPRFWRAAKPIPPTGCRLV